MFQQAMCVLALGSVATLVALAGPNERVPVLLELFTSEGCSSCPPADRVLELLDKNPPDVSSEVVVLSEHVDYFDDAGWKDPFSSAELTRRQGQYVRRFHLDSLYTPQLVIDGARELVGSDAAGAKAAIQKAARVPKLPLDFSVGAWDGKSLPAQVNVPMLPNGGGPAEIFVALADNWTESKVLRGENSGRTLKHVAVVRKLVLIGSTQPGRPFSKAVVLAVPAGAGANGLRIVAFAQDHATGHVVGVAKREIQR